MAGVVARKRLVSSYWVVREALYVRRLSRIAKGVRVGRLYGRRSGIAREGANLGVRWAEGLGEVGRYHDVALGRLMVRRLRGTGFADGHAVLRDVGLRGGGVGFLGVAEFCARRRRTRTLLVVRRVRDNIHGLTLGSRRRGAVLVHDRPLLQGE